MVPLGLMGRPLLWSSDTPSWHRTQTDVFQYHFNYIIYTQHFSFRKTNKKSTPSSYLWKVLFPTVIEIRIPFHPSGKRKKKKNKDLGHLQKRWLVVRVLWRSPGALTTWGAERLKGSGLGRQRQKESAGRLRPQLNPGVRERREEAIETEVKVRT